MVHIGRFLDPMVLCKLTKPDFRIKSNTGFFFFSGLC